jgi:hypothetical protein
MEWLWGGVGWLVGWALNALVHELPRSHTVGWPRCAGCGRRVGPLALTGLPLKGAGRCRSCAAQLLRPFAGLELPTAVSFFALGAAYGVSLALLVYSVFAAFLLVVLLIDLRHRWVYGIVWLVAGCSSFFTGWAVFCIAGKSQWAVATLPSRR